MEYARPRYMKTQVQWMDCMEHQEIKTEEEG